jgi:hypothetical protein
VTYELLAARDKNTPRFLTGDLFSGSLDDLLSETQKEISKRQLHKDKLVLEAPRKFEIAVVPTPLATAVPTAVQDSSRVSEP